MRKSGRTEGIVGGTDGDGLKCAGLSDELPIETVRDGLSKKLERNMSHKDRH